MQLTDILSIRGVKRPLILAMAALCLEGCSSLYNGYAAKPLDLREDHTANLQKKITEKMKDAEQCFMTQYEEKNEVLCSGRRNQVISLLMAESGFLCVEHLKDIYGKEASFNIATGSIASLASGIAAISTGGTATSLAALSAFSNAERSLVNETVYKNLLTTAIATKIEESRNASGKALLSKKTQAYSGYRIEDAINDVLQYHQECSFYRGLQLALAEGTQTNPASKRAQLEAKAQALALQIDARTSGTKVDRNVLDSAGGTSSIKDPILKALVDQYQDVQREIGLGGSTSVAKPALITLSPPKLAFPDPPADAPTGAAAARSLVVTYVNNTAQAVTIFGAVVSGAGFGKGADTCSGQVISAGLTCSVAVTFTPTGTPGDRNGYVTIADDTAVGQHKVALSGQVK